MPVRKKLTSRQITSEVTTEEYEGKEEINRRGNEPKLTDTLLEIKLTGVDRPLAASAVFELALGDAAGRGNSELVGSLMRLLGGALLW